MGRAVLGLTTLGLAACASTPITGRSQFLIVDEKTAIASSERAYAQMLAPLEQKGKLNTDAKVVGRVRHITGRIVAQAIRMRPETTHWKWSIQVIDDPKTVNAWAMAGGRMAIYTGLIQRLKATDDEIAQVIGHEVSHALARHTAEQMSVAMAQQLGISVLAAGTGNEALARSADLAAQLAIGLPHSRTAESEADHIGIELAARAGYDPRAAVRLWQKMAEVGGGNGVEFLSTHPAPERRQQELNALVPKMMPFYETPSERPVAPLQ